MDRGRYSSRTKWRGIGKVRESVREEPVVSTAAYRQAMLSRSARSGPIGDVPSAFLVEPHDALLDRGVELVGWADDHRVE